MTDRPPTRGTCSVEGCEHPRKARTYCTKHYQRWQKYDDPLVEVPKGWQGFPGGPAGALASRTVRAASGCDEWVGARNRAGYGVLGLNRRHVLTHRLAYGLAKGTIPAGLHVLHHCDNPPCLRTEPDERFSDGHLFVGTDADNHADRASKGRPVGAAARSVISFALANTP